MSADGHERHELWKLADALQMDMRAAQAKLVELRAQLAALNLPDPTRVACPACGLAFSRRSSLAEHLYHAHAGPEPPHWLEAEARAEPDPESSLTKPPLRETHYAGFARAMVARKTNARPLDNRPELPRNSGEVADVDGLTTLQAKDDD